MAKFELGNYQNLAMGSPNYSPGLAMLNDPLSIGTMDSASVGMPSGSLAMPGGPAMGQSGSFMKGFGTDDARLVLGGLQTIGNLWGAWQAMKLAKEQFKFTKEVTNTNLNNQIKTYNTALGDRSRSRAAVEGQSQATAQAYVDQNKLTRSGG
jgi:hypothetical protein